MKDERYYEAVADGVYRAMWQLMTNATDMPCTDFYATIEKAVEKAVGDAMRSVLPDEEGIINAIEYAITEACDMPTSEEVVAAIERAVERRGE